MHWRRAHCGEWEMGHHLAAVAGHTIAFGALPPKKEDGSAGGIDALGDPGAVCASQGRSPVKV